MRLLAALTLAAGGAAVAQPVPQALARAAMRVEQASIVTADGAGRWAAWAAGAAGQPVVHVALLGPRGRFLWQASRPDAFEPSLRTLPQWRRGGRPVVAFTYAQGAGAQSVELIGVDGRGVPVVIAREDASAVEWRAAASGDLQLVLYDRAGSALTPRCMGWDGTRGTLAAARCGP